MGDDDDNRDARIVAALSTAEPLTPRQLRSTCRVRMTRVYDALQRLAAAGRILRTAPATASLDQCFPLPLPLAP